MDVATATPSPGEHGDSATDLPSKRLTVVNVLGPMNVVGSATLCSSFCGGIIRKRVTSLFDYHSYSILFV